MGLKFVCFFGQVNELKGLCVTYILSSGLVCWLEAQADGKNVSCLWSFLRRICWFASAPIQILPTVVDQAWGESAWPRKNQRGKGRGTRLGSGDQGVSWSECVSREPISGFSESGSAWIDWGNDEDPRVDGESVLRCQAFARLDLEVVWKRFVWVLLL